MNRKRHIDSFKPIKLPDQLKFENNDDEDQSRFQNLPGYNDKSTGTKKLSRKEERKKERQDKKIKKHEFYNRGKNNDNNNSNNDNSVNKKQRLDQDGNSNKTQQPPQQKNKSKAQLAQEKLKNEELNEQKKMAFLKSIGKTKSDLMSQDDKEIAMLEKKLGLNKKNKKEKKADDTDDENDGLDVFIKPTKKPQQSKKVEIDDSDDGLQEFEEDEGYNSEDDDEEEYDEDDEQPDEESDKPTGVSYIDDMFDDLEKTLGGGYSDEDEEENEDLAFNYDYDDLQVENDQVDENDENEEDDDENEEDDDENEEDDSESEFDEKDLKEDIYGRIINKKTGEIVKDNKIISEGSAPSNKYVPPHLRAAAATTTTSSPSSNSSSTTNNKNKLLNSIEVDPILQRKIKGLLNKLAINNFYAIFNEINDLFNTNPRNSMKQCLTDLIILNCCSEEQVQHHIIHISCALMCGLHSSIGTDVGGMFIETVFKGYTEQQKSYENGNGNSNLISNYLLLFIHLYNFQVLGSKIIFDMAKNFIEGFKDIDIQLLLLLIQNAGYQLRGEDPATLKDIILLVQKKQLEQKQKRQEELMKNENHLNNSTNNTPPEEQEKVTKLSFMMDTISNLKNNKIKNTKLIDTLTALKKVIKGALKSKDLSMNNNQMKISWDDLLSIETKGRWWLVGSSWAGNDDNPLLGIINTNKKSNSNGVDGITIKNQENNSALIKLAIANKMNTDLRKSIFVILMSSEDYLDAFDKIMELKLKDKQDREVIHVLMHCCLKEKKFNPYYYHLVHRLCLHDSNFKFTLQYDIWDQLKDLEINGTTSTGMQSINNFSNLLARLIENHVFSLTVLRVLDLNQQLSPIQIVFFRILFTYLLTQPSESDVTTIFERLISSTQNKVSATKESQSNALSLKKGINLFFVHGLLSSNSASSDPNYKLLKHRIKLVKQVLKSNDSILL